MQPCSRPSRTLPVLILGGILSFAGHAPAVATTDLDTCADERVKTTLLSMQALVLAEAACERVIARTSVGVERQKAAFFRGLFRFLRVVQSGAAKVQQRDGSLAYAAPTLSQLRAALEDIEVAIALEGPLKGDALTLRATVNQTIGRDGQAQADIDRALQVAPRDPTPFVQRALDRQRTGDLTAALADLDHALELDPRAGTALWARGDLLRRLGLLVRARADLAAAADVGPPFRRLALTQKSALELRSGDIRAAYDDLMAAARERSDLPRAEAASATAELLVAAGDLALDKLKEADAAEKLYRDALKLVPSQWSALLGLARVEEQRGARAKAIAIYKRILTATRSTPKLYERILASFRLKELTRPSTRAEGPFRTGLDAGQTVGAGSPDGLKRVAFVIGASDYEKLASLPNARRDAAVVANALAEMGFDSVEIAENLGGVALRSVPGIIARRAAEADIVLVYFAGHGVETGGSNYLVPVDAEPESDAQLQAEALALVDLTRAAARARRGSLVIVDACRDDPFAEARAVAGSRSAGMGQEPPSVTRAGLTATPVPAVNHIVFHSTEPGRTALDGDGLESPFLRSLLETLTSPGLPLDAVVKDTTARVMERTGGRQIPTAYGEALAVPLLPLAPRR
jgi:tetratricopeptide (TPR) repeat protein